jgi:hypothetical protein
VKGKAAGRPRCDIVAARNALAAPVVDLAPEPEVARLKVLLAEDHPVNQRVIQPITAGSLLLVLAGALRREAA